jgi:TusA-related sulfurtransferase
MALARHVYYFRSVPQPTPTPDRTVDARGLRCPLPLIKARNEIDLIASGQVLEVLATDPGADHDLRAWSKRARHEFVSVTEEPGPLFRFLLRKA